MIKETIFQKNSAYFSFLNEMRNLLRYMKKLNDQLSKLDSSLHAWPEIQFLNGLYVCVQKFWYQKSWGIT